MTRTVATLLALFAVSAASPAWVKERSGRPKAQAAPPTSLAAVLARAGVDGATMALRDLLDEAVAPLAPAQVYDQDRAAIRVCHAERYEASRSNLVDSDARPLRDC